MELAARRGSAFAPRLTRSLLQVEGPGHLSLNGRGTLSQLKLVPLAVRPRPPEGFVQLRVRAVGLNFRDVLNVMGLYPGDPGPPGADCSGTVLELGAGTGGLRTAQDVFGEAPGCLATYAVAPAPLLALKPADWSFEEAAAMPVIFVTVEESLGELAALGRGDRVLIHAAAGGVGLAAIQYAQYVGAEVFATAGAEEKHAYLRGLGVKYISSSRDGAKFEQEMRHFLTEAGAGGGVDVVLNSFSHDDYIARSLSLLRQGGRFVEIGKRGIWTDKMMTLRRPDVSYHVVAADTMMEEEPWRYNELLTRMSKRIEDGGLRPINLYVFDGLGEGVRALQFLRQAQNIGKVVIRQPCRMGDVFPVAPMLSGGTGALGLVVGRHLVEEGCKTLHLLSRSGTASPEVGSLWEWLMASVTEVVVHRCDISQEANVATLCDNLSGRPTFTCLLHLAGVLADALIPHITRDLIKTAYGPKVHGLYHLAGHLPFAGSGAPVAVFSSTSSLFGAPGQACYAAANSTLDAVAAHWTARGERPTTSVQWGPWAEVGMAARNNTVLRTQGSGLHGLSTEQGLSILGSVVRGTEVVTGALNIEWPKFLRAVFDHIPAFYEDMEAEAKWETSRTEPTQMAARQGPGQMALANLPKAKREEAIRSTLLRLAKDVIGNEELADNSPFLDSGLDSLSAVELKNRLQVEFGGLRIPNSAVFDYPSVSALAGFISDRLGEQQAVKTEANRSAIGEEKKEETEEQAEAVDDSALILKLNSRTDGLALFLVPGATLQADAFRPLAGCLPFPVFAFSWPRSERVGPAPGMWPRTLKDLAAVLVSELRAVRPSGPYLLGGHSFGATLCVEMARLLEAEDEEVASVMLLDPRTLLPAKPDLETYMADMTIVDTLALLHAQNGSTDATSATSFRALLLDDLLGPAVAAEHRAAHIRTRLGAAGAGLLGHCHATFEWFSGLIIEGSTGSDKTWRPELRSRVCVLTTPLANDESEASSPQSDARKALQLAVFHDDQEVAHRVQNLTQTTSSAPLIASVAGGHFGMLTSPHVGGLALQICHSFVEASVQLF